MIEFFIRGSCKTPAYEKIDDFEASCKGSLGCPVPSNEPNPSRVGESAETREGSDWAFAVAKQGMHEASKGRFYRASEFCNCLIRVVLFFAVSNVWAKTGFYCGSFDPPTSKDVAHTKPMNNYDI